MSGTTGIPRWAPNLGPEYVPIESACAQCSRALVVPLDAHDRTAFLVLLQTRLSCGHALLQVLGLTSNVRKMFRDMDEQLYEECRLRYEAEEVRPQRSWPATALPKPLEIPLVCRKCACNLDNNVTWEQIMTHEGTHSFCFTGCSSPWKFSAC